MKNYPKITKKNIKFYVIAAIILVIMSVAAKIIDKNNKPTPSGNLEITFIDVAQGDSTLIRTSTGETILIDGGEYDVYDSHLVPYLESAGISKINTAIATHYHSDHIGGIYELVEHGGAERLILPDYEDTDNTKDKIVSIAEKNGTAVEYASEGDFITNGCQGLEIQVIHPRKGGSDGSDFHNNSSLVLKITYGGSVFLVTGDIESRAEKEIVEAADVECDVLKVAHHGSSSSSSKRFLEEADPTYGIISVGKDNSYGHPHNEVMERLENDDVRIYRTDRDGSITFVVGEEKIEEIRYSQN